MDHKNGAEGLIWSKQLLTQRASSSQLCDRNFERAAKHQCPIPIADCEVITIETVIHERHSSTPHQENDTLVVKLRAKNTYSLAMVHHRMIPATCSQYPTD